MYNDLIQTMERYALPPNLSTILIKKIKINFYAKVQYLLNTLLINGNCNMIPRMCTFFKNDIATGINPLKRKNKV